MSTRVIAIIGLGMMGSSLGMALRGAHDGDDWHLLGTDVDPDTVATALALGAIDETGPIEAIASQADVVVLAAPVRSSIELTPLVAESMHDGAVLTDLCSTKTAICGVFDSLDVTSVGGHPMCGSEQSGPDAARGDIFRGAIWALCPTGDRTGDREALETITELVAATGAASIVVDASEHDRAAAAASHAPFVAACALVEALARADERTDGLASALAATGFRSATRVAGGSPDMWRDILLTNSNAVRASLADVRAQLDLLDAALDDADVLDPLLHTMRAQLATIHRS